MVDALIVHLLDFGEHGALKQTCTDNENRHIGVAGDNLRVSHDFHRRAVENHVIILALELLEHGLEARRIEHLRRIGRQCAYWYEVEPIGAVHAVHHNLVERGVARKQCAQTLGRAAGIAAQRGLAEVEVDHTHPLILDGKHSGKVYGDECLAGTRIGRCDHNGACAYSFRIGHQLEVGADYAESLVDYVAHTLLDHHHAAVGLVGRRLTQTVEATALLVAQRYLAHERNGEHIEVLAAAHPGIEVFSYVDKAHGDEQTHQECHKHHVAAVGGHGSARPHRRRDNAGIVGGKCLRQLILLTLLEQIEIKTFLYLLLALHAQKIAGLGRVGLQMYRSGGTRALGGTNLRFEGHHIVVDRLKDSLTHAGKLIVEVDHERV